MLRLVRGAVEDEILQHEEHPAADERKLGRREEGARDLKAERADQLVPPPTALRWAFAYETLPEDFFTTCAKAPRKRGRE